MAVIISGNPVQMMAARAIGNSGMSQNDFDVIRHRTEQFQQDHNINIDMVKTMNLVQEQCFSDEAMLISQQLLNATVVNLARDIYKPITFDNYRTDSFVTMDMIASHPVISKRIDKNLLNGFQSDIGVVSNSDLNDNTTYLDIMEGYDNNPYENYTITAHEYYDSIGTEHKGLSNEVQDSAIDLYELIDTFNNIGIDITTF